MTLPGDDSVLLLHNPLCSKSRAALALLEERGEPFELRRYLDEPLTREELEDLCRRLDRPAISWLRRGESAWSDTKLGEDAGDGAILDAMAEQPVLMERPILVRGARAIVGRPPKNVLELLD